MKSLNGHNKCEEAKHLLKRGMNLVATIGDGDIKKEEVDAMQEMGSKVERSNAVCCFSTGAQP